MVDAPHPDQTESVRQQLLQTPSPLSILPQFLPITTTGGSCDPCKWLSRQPLNCRATRLADKEKGRNETGYVLQAFSLKCGEVRVAERNQRTCSRM